MHCNDFCFSLLPKHQNGLTATPQIGIFLKETKVTKSDLLLTQGSITFAAGTGGSAQILLDLLLMEKCKNCSPHTHVANFTEVRMNKSFLSG